MVGMRRFSKKKLFALDELALVLAFFAALIVRYTKMFPMWPQFYDGLYVSLLVFVVLVQAIIFMGYDARRASIMIQDTAQNVFTVIKGRFLLFIAIILYLYIIQQGTNSSRFVIAAIVGFDGIFSFVFRMLLKRHYIRKFGTNPDIALELRAPFPDENGVKELLSGGKYTRALVFAEDADTKDTNRICEILENEGMHPYVALNSLGYSVKSGIVSDINGHASIPVAVRSQHCDLFGIHYAVARTEEAVLHVIRHIKELSGEYICFSNVHTSVMARESHDYRRVLNGSAYTFPDGNPIAQFQQKMGYDLAERVAGPDFMEHMFKNTADGQLSHFFYGASQETLDALKESLNQNYPGLVIKGMYSPPFRALTPEEDKADVEMLNAADADIIWIGLGAPKQEKWMQAHKGQVKGVMMGVGAGFDFHAGTIKRAPKWIQNIGFEWLYRLFQDPGRLVKRYVVTNAKYMFYMFLEKFR
ncbi:WecB/TagA/CpsF family glycosyltransferase [Butyrivibrio sp. VCB2006]|uniref:WecB/TagA/CpsF family glycosyltransferase n=1 Tax=Butyrivibrio sp. VCB2006 TaxID=1280679 RepID=UPI000402BE35|nr:WecB/TagA/CpsF family glycosyltransferase [Butyrivibrio sp. VCB2006]